MSISTVFDKYALNYDGSRRRLIPCFDDFYGTALDAIPFAAREPIRVLDLGAGTGLMTALVAARYPEAAFTLVDVSEQMLAQARLGLAHLPNTLAFVAGDYSGAAPFAGGYDLVISALSIHHLDEAKKRSLFAKVYASLAPGGIFVNADQVLGDTPEIESVYRQRWLDQVRANGVSEADLAAALERMREDRMSTLGHQLDWLRESGFDNVNCWYQNLSFTVVSGARR